MAMTTVIPDPIATLKAALQHLEQHELVTGCALLREGIAALEAIGRAPLATIGAIRRDNLERLCGLRGTLESIAEAADTSSVYLSQIRNQVVDRKTKRPREMGSELARRIEVTCGLAEGWMDVHRGSGLRAPEEGRAWRSQGTNEVDLAT